MPYADPEKQRKALRRHYDNNKPYYAAKSRRRNSRIRAELQTRVLDYLLGHPCVDCDEGDPVVLEFDHVVGDKVDNIADLIRKAVSVERLDREMEKCEIRCANCHRRRTAQQQGSWKIVQRTLA
jgi:hypothetical protein